MMITERGMKARAKNEKAGFTSIQGKPRYIDMAEYARDPAIDAGIAELNGRESLTWTNQMISIEGYVDDATTFAELDTELGGECGWTAGPTATGGTLKFQNAAAVALTRTPSDADRPGSWARPPQITHPAPRLTR